jgi:hypothetical protein
MNANQTIALEARAHAASAARMLDRLEGIERELADLTPQRRLELEASGVNLQLNADRRWTAELAIAHALTALALNTTRGPIYDSGNTDSSGG